jgi:hypothetical protein
MTDRRLSAVLVVIATVALATPNWRPVGVRVIETHDSFGSDHRPVLGQLVPVD